LNKQINKLKIGLLGGSFNPAHNGHLEISKIAFKKFNLDYVLWAITKKNPFKLKYKISLSKRLLFAKNLAKNNKFIKVKFFEEETNSIRTIDLVKYLKTKNPSIKIYFIMGADSLISLNKWKKWKEILKFCNILVFDRYGYKTKALKSTAAKYMNKKKWSFIKFKTINISSSKIRKI
tara:strand:+ start:153 stop:683 length:531 start_codon:yes stop_codon:yes gene_type:complete